jgi:hypothetical protein
VREAHYIFNSHALFHIAKEAAKNAATGASLQDNVVIAVVFSVVGAEAFINEAFEALLNLDLVNLNKKESKLSLNWGDKSKSLGDRLNLSFNCKMDSRQ